MTSTDWSDRQTLTLSDGARIVLRRYGQPGRTRLVFSHGNGLAIDGYRVFWSLFCDEFDVVVFDMRSHGVNPVHAFETHDFSRMAQDMQEIWQGIDTMFGVAPSVGVFHSMSSIASALHLARHGPACEALVLFDPPVYPPHGHPLEAPERRDMEELTRRALRRPTAYDDPADLAAQFARRPAFRNWVPGAAEDLARATLRHDPENNRWVLACPREYEAKIFETNDDAAVWSVLTEPTPLPVAVIAGDPALEGQGPPALLSEAIGAAGHVDYAAVPGSTHFLQIEFPQVCADEVLRFLRARAPALLTDA